MPSIAGPRVQMPQAIAEPIVLQKGERGEVLSVAWRQDWPAFFSTLQQLTFNMSRSGPTASRPTSTTPNRFVGMQYFDTTLGYPVWMASVSTWVRYDGTVV